MRDDMEEDMTNHRLCCESIHSVSISFQEICSGPRS